MQGGSAEGTQVGSGAAGSGDTASPFHNLSAQTFLRLPESEGKARSASLSMAQDAAALKKSIAAAILSVRAGQSSAPGSLRVGVQGNIGARISPAFASQAGYSAPPSESLRAAASAMAKRAAARAPEVADALAAAAPAAEEGGVPGEGVPLGAPSTKGPLPTAAETHLAHRTELQARLRALLTEGLIHEEDARWLLDTHEIHTESQLGLHGHLWSNDELIQASNERPIDALGPWIFLLPIRRGTVDALRAIGCNHDILGVVNSLLEREDHFDQFNGEMYEDLLLNTDWRAALAEADAIEHARALNDSAARAAAARTKTGPLIVFGKDEVFSHGDDAHGEEEGPPGSGFGGHGSGSGSGGRDPSSGGGFSSGGGSSGGGGGGGGGPPWGGRGGGPSHSGGGRPTDGTWGRHGASPAPLVDDSMRMQMTQNNAMIAALLQHTISAGDKTHKPLRPLPNPGHPIVWATTALDFTALADMTTSLSPAEVTQAIPKNMMAMEAAQPAVAPNKLLSGFCTLVLNLPSSSSPVSAIDFAGAHVALLFKLVKAYGATPDRLAIDAMAAESVYHALEWCGAAAANAGAAKLRVAWHVAKGSPVPTSPWPLFMAIARAYLPVDNWQGRDADYREYLANHYTMQSPESAPSFVFGAAVNLARNKHVAESSGHVREAKELFVAWARQLARRDSSLAPLMDPLLQLFSQPFFYGCTLIELQAHIARMEAEGNQLHSLISSLPSHAMPAAAKLPRKLGVNAIPGIGDGGLGAPAGPVAAAVSHADVYAMIAAAFSATGPSSAPASVPAPAAAPVALSTAGVQSMISSALARSLNAQPAALTAADVQAMIAAAVMPSAPPPLAQGPTAPLTQGPTAPAGLHAAMAPFFAPPAVYAVALPLGFVLKDDQALAVSTMIMNDGWVTQYGCKDLAPAPAAPSKDRIVLDVKAICEACVIPFPAGLDVADHRQIGGPECPFCYVLGALRGLPPLEFHIHPLDAEQRQLPPPPPKPKAANHRYMHRIAKCPAGTAIAHRLVRLDRDAGRTVRASLLAPLPTA